ncbi:MAG: NADP-dependent oxidoreductase [Marmoricola sp.]
MQSTQIVLRQRPVGSPNAETFEVRTSELPDIQEGEVLLAIRYLSLDPYMRGRLSTAKSYAAPVEIGQVMVGATVGQVLATRHERLHEGDWVVSYSGWQTHAAEHGDMVRKLDPSIAPVTTALGVLGMPGMTAYWGLLEIGRPQPGETVSGGGYWPGGFSGWADRPHQGRPCCWHCRWAREMPPSGGHVWLRCCC